MACFISGLKHRTLPRNDSIAFGAFCKSQADKYGRPVVGDESCDRPLPLARADWSQFNRSLVQWQFIVHHYRRRSARLDTVLPVRHGIDISQNIATFDTKLYPSITAIPCLSDADLVYKAMAPHPADAVPQQGGVMKKLTTWMTGCMLAAGTGYAVSVYALPMPGPMQEVFSIYYLDSARTQEAGVRAHYHDIACDTWHADWGITTQYRRVVTAGCLIGPYPEPGPLPEP
jgi:hypothetical protein